MSEYRFDGNLIADESFDFDRSKGIAYDKDGNEIKLEALLTFSCDELNKDYVALTDWSYTVNGELNIGIFSYIEKDGNMTDLVLVEDEDELLMAKDVIDDSLEYLDNLAESEGRK